MTLFLGQSCGFLSDRMGREKVGAVAGLLLTGMGVGAVFGPWLGGYIYDVAGTYRPAFLLCIVCISLACLAFWIAAPRRGPTTAWAPDSTRGVSPGGGTAR